jgi:uncharacterized protein (TIGR02246 family)
MYLLSDVSVASDAMSSGALLAAAGAGAALATVLRGSPAGTPTLKTAQEEVYGIAQANFNAWNSALQSGDPERVASLYSATYLSFLPTVSRQFVRDAPSTKNYFIEFVKKMPAGTITGDHVQVFGDDSYLHTGMYTFMTGEAKNRVPVQARFSYMWRKIDGAWKIVHHHSSALPNSAPAAKPAEVVIEDMYPVAQENFHRWNEALKSKNPDQVAALYSTSDLSFLPTVSGNFIRDPSSTRAYFVEFIKKTPEGTITADDVQTLGPDAYLHTGMYTFMVGPDEARTPVQARFSYMWRRVNGDWKICHHHSSAVPGVAPAAPVIDYYPTAQENFKRWNDALKAKDYEKVASIYCTKSLSFLPTVSPKFIRDAADTKQYFVEFLKKLPEGTITADDVQTLGPDAYLHSGMYTFMTGPENARAPVQARFSYMWRKVDGEWKITHHHSSALPASPATPVDVPHPENFSIDTDRDSIIAANNVVPSGKLSGVESAK